jgi:hypothetical protein
MVLKYLTQKQKKKQKKTMSDDKLSNRMKEKLEKEFYEMLERGEDVKHFLYFPMEILTDGIKDYLDKILCEEAWKQIEKGKLSETSFVAYEDDLITINFDEIEYQVELLERLLNFYEAREAYEKCARIKEILNTKI